MGYGPQKYDIKVKSNRWDSKMRGEGKREKGKTGILVKAATFLKIKKIKRNLLKWDQKDRKREQNSARLSPCLCSVHIQQPLARTGSGSKWTLCFSLNKL